MDAEIVVLSDPIAVAQEAARRFTHSAVEAAGSRGRFSVALSGGSTPGALYSLLAEDPYRERVPWKQVYFFWGDERCVPPDDPGSNFRWAHEALISRVSIPPENVVRVRGELAPAAAAKDYAAALQDFFCGPWPRFDLVLLGLGIDGHTASLFPGSAALQEKERLAIAVEAHYQDRPAYRITLTLPAINAARQVLFLVTGSAKAEIVQAVLGGSGTASACGPPSAQAHRLSSGTPQAVLPMSVFPGLTARTGGAGRRDLPARYVQPTAGQLTWLLDAAAASQLGERREMPM